MNLVTDFLSAYTGNTARAYARDLADWSAFLAERKVALLAVKRAHVDAFVRHMETEQRSASTMARRLSCVSGLYAYAIAESLIKDNPVVNVRRPKVSQDSQTLGLTQDEARMLLKVAKEDSPRAYALVSLCLMTGCRIGEALDADLSQIRIDGGHRVIRFNGKGGKVRVIPLASAAGAIDAYLGGRTEGPLFATRSGRAWTQSSVFRTLQRLALLAGIAEAERVTPHSLRHTSLTGALIAGAALHEVQDFAGHADPRTTRRYDRARMNLDRSPAHALGAYFGG